MFEHIFGRTTLAPNLGGSADKRQQRRAAQPMDDRSNKSFNGNRNEPIEVPNRVDELAVGYAGKGPEATL